MRPRVARHGSFPTTADMGLWARGPTPESLYEGLGEALFGAMTDLRRVRARETRSVERSADDPVRLAVGFLGELLLEFHAEGFVARRVRVRLGPGGGSLTASLCGEPFEEGRHSRRIEVKAVTLHAAEFDPARGRARVIVDI